MSLCGFCGHPTLGARDLCSYHDSGYDHDWAAGNRLMCDFLHRGIVSSWAPVHRVLDDSEVEAAHAA